MYCTSALGRYLYREMVVPRGILNKNAIDALENSLSGSGILRVREITPGNKTFDVNQPAAQLQKSSVLVGGAGRLVIGKGAFYVPEYTNGIGVAAGSGYIAPSDGVYQVDATVAVSGVAIETFAGAVLVDGVAASGTESFQTADARGAASVTVHGVVNVAASQVINVGVKSLHGNLTTIGAEDLVHAPAANIRVLKLGSDELSFN